MQRQQYILIVENDKTLQELFTVILTDHGHAVVTAGTAQEAEAAMAELGPTAIGLVISEIKLARHHTTSEGYDLYQRWTMAHPSLPYLLISGDRVTTACLSTRDSRVTCLTKPFSLNELLNAVHALLS